MHGSAGIITPNARLRERIFARLRAAFESVLSWWFSLAHARHFVILSRRAHCRIELFWRHVWIQLPQCGAQTRAKGNLSRRSRPCAVPGLNGSW